MSKGKTGHRGTRGIRGEKGDSGGDAVFIKVSNQEVYTQIKNLQITNDAGHATIIEKIDALEKRVNLRIEVFEEEYRIEHEKLKGQVNIISLTAAGISAVLISAVWILLSHLGIKP